ncbi:hypothetical protein SY88_16575 [Clostridiales bacterium PH28_bin88]|nr:hypothetical protein SY88_16575 [Clostridiales bacterium PH28_bin88]
MLDTDVLVIGGGAAGCFAAVKAAAQGARVILADKGRVGRSGCSPFAAGAINICLPEDDPEAWLEEIVVRGEYLNDQEWVRLQLEKAYPLAMELQAWGKERGLVILEEDQQGRLRRRKARGNINTLTAMINALPMMDTLRRKAREKQVSMVERVMVTHLVKDGERVAGAVGIGTRTGELFLFRAGAVVLTAGGCGFKAYFIGHQNLTGEGQLMAYRAGAKLRNLDQAMSNTTARDFDIHGLSLMVGSGGRFINAAGEEFMYRYDPQLGSRARLTRLVIGMAMEVEAGRGPIYLDLSPVGSEDRALLQKLLPEGFRAFARLGLDPFSRPVEWMPAFEGTLVHGGGIHIDTRCATGLPGLYAAGDATCSPVHGTWSITGLNLTFAFLSGAIAGEQAAGEALAAGQPPGGGEDLPRQVEIAARELTAPLRRSGGVEPDQVVSDLLGALIPYPVAYLRSEEALTVALQQVERVRDHCLSMLTARDAHGLVKVFEVRSMICLAELVLRSVLFRQESRGFVFRKDFPLTDNVHWLKWVMVGKGERGPEVEAVEFPTPYLPPPREVYSPR